mmetsp:Transcript_57485/g.95073  ORF Transcript_57485/g.95073 Transcript_57485/m.95073 type:complete len:102 (-) Transcript_57485:533-838(-)
MTRQSALFNAHASEYILRFVTQRINFESMAWGCWQFNWLQTILLLQEIPHGILSLSVLVNIMDPIPEVGAITAVCGSFIFAASAGVKAAVILNAYQVVKPD